MNRFTGNRIRAMVLVHIFGHPCDLNGLSAVARDFNLVLIEDASESLGSEYQGQYTGTFGLFGTLSFNGNKTITTGEGGIVLTDNDEIADKCYKLKNHGRSEKGIFKHETIGFNFSFCPRYPATKYTA